MKLADTLSTRIAIGMLALLAVGSILFGLLLSVTYQRMEHSLLDVMDAFALHELSNLSADRSATLTNKEKKLDNILITYSPTKGIIQRSELPKELLRYTSGFHHDVEVNDRRYHLAVQDWGGVQRYFAIDITDLEQRETELGIALWIVVLTILAIAGWLIYWLSRKVIQPVSSLAQQLATLDPHDTKARLAKKFEDYEVAVIARSFDRFMERLEGFIEREQSFTSAASHELRTPLSVITTSAELLDQSSNLSMKAKESILRIRKNAQNMSQLISGLLFLAREDQTHDYRELNPVSLTEVVKRCVEDIQLYDKDANVVLRTEYIYDISISAPESHVSIVINNLLRNSFDHTRRGCITIRITQSCFELQDTGEGIAQQDLVNIFERNFRGQKSKGHGLGLYIVKQVCERYGWKIHIDSQLHTGTTAKVTF